MRRRPRWETLEQHTDSQDRAKISDLPETGDEVIVEKEYIP
jgi:hypothetical protein